MSQDSEFGLWADEKPEPVTVVNTAEKGEPIPIGLSGFLESMKNMTFKMPALGEYQFSVSPDPESLEKLKASFESLVATTKQPRVLHGKLRGLAIDSIIIDENFQDYRIPTAEDIKTFEAKFVNKRDVLSEAYLKDFMENPLPVLESQASSKEKHKQKTRFKNQKGPKKTKW